MQTGTLSAAQENVRVCLRFSHSRAIKWKVLQSVKGNRKSSLSFFNGNAGLHCLIRHSREKANLFFCIQRNVRKCPFEERKKTAFSTNLSHAWENPELNSIEWVGYEKLNAHFQFHSQMPILIPIPIPIHLVFRIWFCVCCVWVCVIMEPAKHRHTYINA